MLNKNFVKNAKEKYKKIGSIECPAFNNEKIYFNRKGFQHLLYKKGDRRNKKDQVNRLILLDTAVDIVKTTNTYTEYRNINKIRFWSLIKNTPNKIVTVIICQKTEGQKYFLSVMSKTLPKSTKVP